ncbi:MAG: glycosyltransferase [Lachnospiraceae bacterium]|nr:glycosyltransferase [Lachnospiraceae bacterium]
MKKVLFYIHSLNKGGAEKVLLTVAEELNRSEEYDVTIITDTVDELEYEPSEGIKRIVVDKEADNVSAITRLKVIRRCVKQQDPDKVVVFMLSSVIRAALALFGTKYKFIGAVRSNPYDDYSSGFNRTLLMLALDRCERMVCQTEYQVDFFPERFREKCAVISNPIFEEFVKKAEELSNNKKTDDFAKDRLSGKIAATGRLFDYKNHRMLIRAFKHISEDYPDVNVTIYGEGPYREELENEIEKFGLKDRVFLPGDSSAVAKDISDAIIYVLPSDTEGLPNALMEAMALNLPVISTDCPCGGPKSLIDDGVNGLLVPVGDEEAMAQALKRLLDDGELRNKLGMNAGLIRQTNSVDKIVAAWKELI